MRVASCYELPARRWPCCRAQQSAVGPPVGKVKDRLYEREQVTIVRVATERGNAPSDLRDAVHEISHVIDVGIEDCDDWDREEIHAVLVESLLPGQQFAAECLARATERLACKLSGVAYKPERWVMIAAMESAKGGFHAPLTAWRAAIDSMMADGRAAKRLAAVRDLARRLG